MTNYTKHEIEMATKLAFNDLMDKAKKEGIDAFEKHEELKKIMLSGEFMQQVQIYAQNISRMKKELAA